MVAEWILNMLKILVDLQEIDQNQNETFLRPPSAVHVHKDLFFKQAPE